MSEISIHLYASNQKVDVYVIIVAINCMDSIGNIDCGGGGGLTLPD